MKGFMIFSAAIGTAAGLIIIGNFVRNLMAEAKPVEKKE